MNVKTRQSLSLFILPALGLCSVQANADTPIATFTSGNLQAQHWTAERLKQATPEETLPLSESEIKLLMKGAEQSDKRVNNLQATAGEPERADLKSQPYTTAGKLYYTNDAGKDHYCTAQFVKSKNLLLTAGHCLRNTTTHKWYTNFMFFPRYESGPTDYAIHWYCATTWNSFDDPMIRHAKDYGFIYTTTASTHGYLGYKINNEEPKATAIGYPKNYGSGHYLMKVEGQRVITPDEAVEEMKNNPMHSGNSGGAWIIDVNTDNTGHNYVVGLNSFHYTNYPDSEYSPRFDSAFSELATFGNNRCAE